MSDLTGAYTDDLSEQWLEEQFSRPLPNPTKDTGKQTMPEGKSEIPADIMKAAEKAFKYGFGLRYEVAIKAIAEAILDERQKAETLADEMYLTGVTNAEVWARKWGHHDFADRLVREVNERAKASGLPPMRASA